MLVLALFSAGARIRDRAFISPVTPASPGPSLGPDAVRADHSRVVRTKPADVRVVVADTKAASRSES